MTVFRRACFVVRVMSRIVLSYHAWPCSTMYLLPIFKSHPPAAAMLFAGVLVGEVSYGARQKTLSVNDELKREAGADRMVHGRPGEKLCKSLDRSLYSGRSKSHPRTQICCSSSPLSDIPLPLNSQCLVRIRVGMSYLRNTNDHILTAVVSVKMIGAVFVVLADHVETINSVRCVQISAQQQPFAAHASGVLFPPKCSNNR